LLAEKKEKPRLIVICGPTAVGKTALSVELAQHLNTVILSADSRQFYKELNAATAKPNSVELAAVKHYFIDSLSIWDDYSAGHYEREALELLGTLFEEHQDVLIVGGSGLYIQALTHGIDYFPDVDPRHLEELETKFETLGIEALQNELKHSDPTYFEQVDTSNPRRLIRALSVIRQSGQPYSSFLNKNKSSRFFDIQFVKLALDRKMLYERIDSRVDSFFEMGLLEEAKTHYPNRKLKALQTVGYTELFDFFEGKYASINEAADKIKQHSRNYAKRQETWLRSQVAGSTWSPNDLQGIYNHLQLK